MEENQPLPFISIAAEILQRRLEGRLVSAVGQLVLLAQFHEG